MYYVYVIRRKRDNAFYIGYTEDLKRRIKQHKQKGDLQLIYYEAYLSEKIARLRERKLKYYGSAWRALKKKNYSLEGGVFASLRLSIHVYWRIHIFNR